MANPQIENGFVRIANEIVDHLCYYRLSGQEYQVLWVILRKTYGWNKKQDNISISQFFSLTKIKKPNIIRSLKKLEEKNIVIKKDNNIATLYKFNKDYNSWKSLSKKITYNKSLSKKIISVIKKDNKSLSKKIHTKDNIKDNITKDIIYSKQSLPINQIMDIFYKINPSLNYGNKTNRDAIEWLVNKFGLDKTCQMAEYACSIQGKKYAPVITTPYQFKNKLAELKIYYEKNKINQVIKI